MSNDRNITLADFSGTWALERQIKDFRLGCDGFFRGCVEFRQIEDGLYCRESGHLQMAGQTPMTATREYMWRTQGMEIAVSFSDGRHFHSFNPNKTDPIATYDCPPDIYRARYRFGGGPIWQAEWLVNGPKKRYQSTSTYRR